VIDGQLFDLDVFRGGSINALHSGFGTVAKCVDLIQKFLVGLRKLVDLFNRLMMIRFVTEFANEQLF
jgi:hypothetical protein